VKESNHSNRDDIMKKQQLFSSLLSFGMITAASSTSIVDVDDADAESNNLRGRGLGQQQGQSLFDKQGLFDKGNDGGVDKVTVIITLKKKDNAGSSTSTSTKNMCKGKAKNHGGSVTQVYSTVLQGCAIDLPRAAISSLMNDADVELVEEDGMMYAIGCNNQSDGSCDDPNPTWGLDRIDQCASALSGTTFNKKPATNVLVFSLDTGVRGDHVEFQGMINSNSNCHKDFTGEGDPLIDNNGHGYVIYFFFLSHSTY
jgi:hypothetical protein